MHFRKFGVEVVLVKTSVDRTNAFAPMLSAFEGVQASQYSKKLSELTFRGANNNGIYSNGGTAPYGYHRIAINTRTGNRRTLQAGEWSISGQEKVCFALGEPEEINVVRMIFEKRLNGESLFLITKSLNDHSIPCPKRGRQSLFVRLKEIEAEADALKTKHSALKTTMERNDRSQKPDSLSISQRVAEFVLDFESRIHEAPIEVQKDLVRKIISEIIVDREKEVVRFYVRRVPAVTPEIENLFKIRRGPSTEIASPQSSGGTLQCAPTLVTEGVIVVDELGI